KPARLYGFGSARHRAISLPDKFSRSTGSRLYSPLWIFRTQAKARPLDEKRSHVLVGEVREPPAAILVARKSSRFHQRCGSLTNGMVPQLTPHFTIFSVYTDH